ncbi:hypothetical protein [Reinekea marinisedimentorum]|uniref:Intracellular proteinase inhibitor BsuPI n=1 Tax=Reinekea marinisedimentorum TaxID=230495 RepID=A0A4R3HTD0_9GAMM|nr:hypothetical protein [Reinekea marinisedimentorum]TCS34782.1 hypothetical protein BCF53_1402 [Reinekea marinisedimentorum]
MNYTLNLMFTFLLLACATVKADITASVIVVDNGNELFRAWNSNPAEGISISPVQIASRGEFLSVIVLFSGCAANAEGNCNVTLDMVVLDPGGNIYGEFKGHELWINKPAPNAGQMQLGVDYMGIVVEPNDLPGNYSVLIKAHDMHTGQTATSKTAFEVEPTSN